MSDNFGVCDISYTFLAEERYSDNTKQAEDDWNARELHDGY